MFASLSFSSLASICLSFDRQITVNEQLTRVVCLAISFDISLEQAVCAHSYDVDFEYLIVCSKRPFFSLSVPLVSFSFHFASLSLSLSLSRSSGIVSVCFYSCLDVRAYIWFHSACVCGTSLLHHLIFLSRSCLSIVRACQRHKHLLLACRNGRPNLVGIGKSRTTKAKRQVRFNGVSWVNTNDDDKSSLIDGQRRFLVGAQRK